MRSYSCCRGPFSKRAHFILCSKTAVTSHAAKIFFNEVVRSHELAKTSVSDHDFKFMSYFAQILRRTLNTDLKVSTNTQYHPKTDGQTEVVNKNLSNLLRCLVSDHISSWYLILPTAKFTYNSLVTGP